MYVMADILEGGFEYEQDSFDTWYRLVCPLTIDNCKQGLAQTAFQYSLIRILEIKRGSRRSILLYVCQSHLIHPFK